MPKLSNIIPNSPVEGKVYPHTNIAIGAGRKPGQVSHRCQNCGKFLKYHPVEHLKKAIKRKKLTQSLEILESYGLIGEEALFIFSLAGGEA